MCIRDSIDPEPDLEPTPGGPRMPEREALLCHLSPLLAELPAPQKIVLHYLSGQVEVEVFLEHAFFADSTALRRAEEALAQRLSLIPI